MFEKGQRVRVKETGTFVEVVEVKAYGRGHKVIALTPSGTEMSFRTTELEAAPAEVKRFRDGTFACVERSRMVGKVLSYENGVYTLEFAHGKTGSFGFSEVISVDEGMAPRRKAAETEDDDEPEPVQKPSKTKAGPDAVSKAITASGPFQVGIRLGLGDFRNVYGHLNTGQQAAIMAVKIRTAIKKNPDLASRL